MRRVDEEMRKRERMEAERKKREQELSTQQAEEERKAIEECERYVLVKYTRLTLKVFHIFLCNFENWLHYHVAIFYLSFEESPNFHNSSFYRNYSYNFNLSPFSKCFTVQVS